MIYAANDPLCHIQAGHPDVIYYTYRWGSAAAGDVCPFGWWEGRLKWECTREEDHPGKHLAGDGVIIVATCPAES